MDRRSAGDGDNRETRPSRRPQPKRAGEALSQGGRRIAEKIRIHRTAATCPPSALEGGRLHFNRARRWLLRPVPFHQGFQAVQRVRPRIILPTIERRLDRLSIAYTIQQLVFAAKIASMERG